MSQQIPVSRSIDFHNKGSATTIQRIDCDDHANIIYWRPTTTDTGYLCFGDGTTDMDVKVFLGGTSNYVLFDVGNTRMTLVGVDITTDGGIATTSGTFTAGVSGTPAGDFTLFGTVALGKVWFDVDGDTNGSFNFGVDDVGLMAYWYGDTASYNVYWDPTGDTNGAWYFGQDDYGVDVVFRGRTASKSMTWDASADGLTFTASTFTMGATGVPAGDFTLWGTVALGKVWFDVDGDTNGAFYFGANDVGLECYWYGDTASYGVHWDPSGDANGAWYFGADDWGVDIVFYGQTASNSMTWDASANALVFVAGGITMGVTSTLILPVKASGSTTKGDIWLDTTDNYIHFYGQAVEISITGCTAA